MSLYFHPILAPAVLALALALLGVSVRSDDRRARFRDMRMAAWVGAGTLLLTVGPALPSLAEQIRFKAVRGQAGVDTLTASLTYLHALPFSVPWPVWGVVFLLGLASLYRRFRRESVWFAVVALSGFEGSRLVGIITERDLVHVAAELLEKHLRESSEE